MLKTLGVVHVTGLAATSPALLSRRLCGKPLLEWVVRRATDSQLLDGVVVAADSPADREILARVVPSVVPVFAPGERDPLATLSATVREFPAQAVVLIGLNSPFIDPVLIDRLVTAAAAQKDAHYVSFVSVDGRPVIESRMGVCAEWLQGEAVRRAHRKASSPADRQSATRFIRSRPDLFTRLLLPAPLPLDRDDVRLALSVDEDWEHAEAICEALGHDALDWQRIAKLLDHQPALRERMAQLNRAESAA